MLDKDKLIIICHLALGGLSKHNSIITFQQARNYFENIVDNSVKIIVVPSMYACENKFETFNVNTETVNEDILNRLEEICEKLKEESNKLMNNDNEL